MTMFQIAALVFLALAFAATVVLRLRRKTSFLLTVTWSLLWIGAAVAIARPQITVRVAHVLGIARGADLVFYLAILGMFVGFFGVYVRLRRLESEITQIVRELALRAPRDPGDS
jgi:small membrane protein